MEATESLQETEEAPKEPQATKKRRLSILAPWRAFGCWFKQGGKQTEKTLEAFGEDAQSKIDEERREREAREQAEKAQIFDVGLQGFGEAFLEDRNMESSSQSSSEPKEEPATDVPPEENKAKRRCWLKFMSGA